MGFTSNGNLYGLGVGNSFDSDLYQINAVNGNTTDLGNVGDVIGAKRPRWKDDVRVRSMARTGDPYTLTPPSSRTAFVGSSYLDNGSDGMMAFSPNGTLFTDEASGNSHNDILASVDTSTGVATPIGSGMGDYIFAGGVRERNFLRLCP